MGRKNKQTKPPSSLKDRLKTATKNPILLFLMVFGVLTVLFYSVWVTDFFRENIFNPILHVNAKIASFILNIFSYGTEAIGMDIYNSAFTISVKRGCDAIEPMALFASAVLAFPAPFRRKIPGIAAGIAFLFLVNIVRIISLFLTGIYFPSAFDLMHLEVWQVVFILLAIVSWMVWIKWAQRKSKLS